MSKDTYTYKEILLGLRDEFIDTESKLRELKDYSLANRKYVSSYHYRLSQTSSDYLPELRVNVTRRQSELMRKLRRLLQRFTYYNDPSSALMVKSNNGIYYPLAGEPFKLGVNPKYKEEFERLATELLESRFANEMNFGEVKSTSGEHHETIATRWYEPKLRLNRERSVAIVDYHGRTDRLKFAGSPNMPLTQELLDEIMATEFPKDNFSEYHQQLIESNPDKDRPVLLPEGYEPTTLGEFQVIDYGHDDKIYLKKRNPRKK